MTTPKFMEFDKQEIAKFSSNRWSDFDHFNSYSIVAIETAKHQHQRDLVLLKKLMEIVELYKRAVAETRIILISEFGLRSYKANFEHIEETRAQVETMIKDLEK